MKRLILLFLTINLALLLSACAPAKSSSSGSSDNTNASLDTLNEDLNVLNDEITQNPFFKETGVVDDAIDAADRQIAARLAFSLTPQSWFRRLTNVSTEVNLNVSGDVANIEHTATLEGTLCVVFDTASPVGEKPFQMSSRRLGQFTRSSNRWQLNAVSLLDAGLYDTTAANVSITQVKISIPQTAQEWIFTDPAQLIDFADGLPTLNLGDQVVIEVTAAPASPQEDVYVYLHTGLARDLMADDGTNGDVTADDGVYTRTYLINTDHGLNLGLNFAIIDVLSAATLDEVAPDNYQAAAWGIPFHVRDSNLSLDRLALTIFANNFPLFWSPDSVDLGLDGIAYRHGKTGDVFWGRQLRERRHRRELEITINGTAADLKTVAHFRGEWRTDMDAALWGDPPVVSQIEEAKVTQARLVKVNNRWELTALSPGNFLPPPNQLTTLDFSVSQFTVKKDAATIFSWANTDPGNPLPLAWDDGYPEFQPGDVITVAAQINSADVYAFLRYGFFQRDQMYDDGTHGDETAADGWYSRTYVIGYDYGYHQAVVDVIKADNFLGLNPGAYQSLATSFVYKVTRP